MRKIIAVTVLAVVAFLASACGGGNSTTALTAKATCAYSFSTWYYHHGGQTEIKTLETNFRPMVKAAETHQHGQAVKDAGIVQNATVQLEGNMPPPCIPNLDNNLRGALLAINSDAFNATKKDKTGIQNVQKDTVVASQDLAKASKALYAYVKH